MQAPFQKNKPCSITKIINLITPGFRFLSPNLFMPLDAFFEVINYVWKLVFLLIFQNNSKKFDRANFKPSLKCFNFKRFFYLILKKSVKLKTVYTFPKSYIDIFKKKLIIKLSFRVLLLKKVITNLKFFIKQRY